MRFAKVFSAQPQILDASIITVEIDISRGLHSFSIVGLADRATEESKDRVSSALKHTGFESPKSKNQKIIVSLAPADVKKSGSLFDVPIAIAYLIASESIQLSEEKILFVGELSLDGKIKRINGTLPIVKTAHDLGFTSIFIPQENLDEAAAIKGIGIFGACDLQDIIDHINIKNKRTPRRITHAATPFKKEFLVEKNPFEKIYGQEFAKRGAVIAAAGRHNILFYGPAGTGKTLLSRSIIEMLPPLSEQESIEVTCIHSAAGILSEPFLRNPPIRSPHHSISHIAMVGGGPHLKPGEITLAHRGVLFLDELLEFERRTIESLRQPLEDGYVSIARIHKSLLFPAQIMLVATMNPCPCGNHGSLHKECVCNPQQIIKYQQKISGPIMDRIDLVISVDHIEYSQLSESKDSKPYDYKKNLTQCLERQKLRFRSPSIYNSHIKSTNVIKQTDISDTAIKELNTWAERFKLSPRGYYKTIKVSRTIADMEDSDSIEPPHILEALQYRSKEN